MNRILLVFAFFLATLAGCKRDVSHTGTPDPQPNIVNPEPVTATIQGNVYNENNDPAAGVLIKVGIKTATTDAKGYFRILNAPLDKHASLVTAEKAGYFKALRSFSATAATNNVSIKLVKKSLTGSVNGTTGGDVTLANGSKISLPANGIVLQGSGAAYTGTINVYAAYIDPTTNDISQTIPGSLMADDKNGSRVTLASYGMLAVELETAGGQKLQVKNGSKATLTAPIPSTMLGSAPATIPMWYLDEASGIWQEEGSATKSGSSYSGQVSHFSFWNYDVNLPGVNLSLKITTGSQPLVHALVKLTASAYPSSSYGFTDSLGQVSGLVPSNQQLVMQVLDQCHNVIYTQNVGPFTQNTTLAPIALAGGTSNAIITVQGSLKNCSGNAVTDGYAIISHGNNYRYVAVDANGNFTTNFMQCPGSSSPTIQVLGVDNGTTQQGNPVTTNVTMPVTNAGNISACGTSSAQFMSFTYNGNNYYLTGVDSIGGNTFNAPTGGFTTSLSAAINSPMQMIYMSFNHSTATTGTPYTVNNYMSVYVNGTSAYTQGATNVQVTFTNFPTAMGQFYEGHFSGTFNSGGAVHTITNGTFRLRRDN